MGFNLACGTARHMRDKFDYQTGDGRMPAWRAVEDPPIHTVCHLHKRQAQRSGIFSHPPFLKSETGHQVGGVIKPGQRKCLDSQAFWRCRT